MFEVEPNEVYDTRAEAVGDNFPGLRFTVLRPPK
jgi:hypothetical protein